MATTEILANNKLESLFENLEAQKSLLTKCTDLYKTLTSHFTNLQQSIDSQTLALDSDLKSITSLHRKSLNDLNLCENSIPERLVSLSSEIESKKQYAIAEVETPVDENAPFMEVVKKLCRRMDHSRLLKFMISKRKETNASRGEMGEVLKECVDPTRMILESVKEFVEAKAKAKRGTDKRWACAVMVSGLFPIEEMKMKKDSVRPAFARKTVERAEAVVKDWRAKVEKAGKEDGGSGSGMGSAEAVLFLQVVVGFGLEGMIEEEYCKNLVMEFADRRDMAKLAVPIFGDKITDLIGQLVKNGKEVEAVYFASEASLMERFQPVSLLKSYLRDSERKSTELKKGNRSAAATDEANNFETNYIRSIVRCVEDNKLEGEFPVQSLKKRLSVLDNTKAAKKKGSAANSKPSNKRVHGSGGPPQTSGAHTPRPAKARKFRSPYPPSYGHQETVSRPLSPVSKYLCPSYLSGQSQSQSQSQTAYDPALTASTYGPRYGATHIPIASQITQQHYGVPGSSAPSAAGPRSGSVPNAAGPRAGSSPSAAGPRVGSTYVLQSPYGVYDYGAAMTSNYQPPYSQ